MRTSEGFAFLHPGIQLYYRTVGEGDETVIVANANWLGEVLTPLAEGRRVVFFDPRGRGRSSAVTDPGQLSFAHDVADLEAVRRFFRLGRVSVVASAYNAAVAARYAVAHAEVVDRLLLVGPITPWRPREWNQELPTADAFLYPPGVRRLDEMRRDGLDVRDRVAFCRAWLTEYLLPAQLAEPSAAARLPVADIAAFPNEWPEILMPLYFDHLLPGLGDWDFRPELAGFRQPLLVVQGTEDLIPIEASREWAAAAPGGRFLPIPGAGAHPYVERPDVFFDAADRFLSGGWPNGALPGGR